MKFLTGADHGGVDLKNHLVDLLREAGHEVEDVGTHGTASVDYPDFGRRVARGVALGEADRGLAVCTNGIGMSILANRYPGVRAALVGDVLAARMCREHLDANVLVLGGGFLGRYLAAEILRVWIETPFAGGRHQRRLDKIADIERELGLDRWLAALRSSGR